MDQKRIINGIGALFMNFEAYAEPSLLGPLADHTYVLGIWPPANYTCSCYGGIQTGAGIVPTLTTGQGDMYAVSAMINGNITLKPVYNSYLTDHCGILYALQGVCHQMTNRILYTADFVTQDYHLHHVRGLRLTTLVYGVLGITRMSFTRRLFYVYTTIGSAAPFLDSSEDFSYTYEDFCNELINKLNISKNISDPVKKLLRLEIRETSTAEKRLEIMYLDAFPEKTGSDPILLTLKTSLGVFMKVLENLEAGITINGEDTPSIEQLNLYAATVNEAFSKFNELLFAALGPNNYQIFAGMTYDKNYLLCEPLSEKI